MSDTNGHGDVEALVASMMVWRAPWRISAEMSADEQQRVRAQRLRQLDERFKEDRP
jgi:hypothetical protein